MKMTENRTARAIWSFISNFALFFVIISFVVTCSFLLFFSTINALSEQEIRAFAPVVFFNVIVLALLFTVADIIRRRVTVAIPMRELERVQKRLMEGDFSARVPEKYYNVKYREIGKIAKGINTLAEELGSVETLRTDFIANVSHEMKTPLSVMHNYGMMLQTPALTEDKRIEYAKAVTQSSKRLADLMTNILKLNRLENQQIFPKTAKYNLGEQLSECMIGFETVWEERKIEIEADIEDSVTVSADGELLSLVWNNLLSNAFKFTPNGGKVSLSLKTEGDFAIVRVADTGIGMSSEVGTHIFEKFYQGDSSHSSEGNGLGLALVKRVVDIVHGEIAVESELGKGSAFTVKLRKEQ